MQNIWLKKKEQQIATLAKEKQIRDLQIARQEQDIAHSSLLAQKQQQQLDIQNLKIEKNNSDLKRKELSIKNSYSQLQAERKEKQLQAAITTKENIQKKFAYAGIAFITVLSGVSFYRYRRRKKLQSEQEMLNERLRISRDLHDDIGSTLGSISIYSEVAKNRTQRNENAEEAISKIGVASRELIDKMSDIVWTMNPNNESMEQLQNRMQVFAAVMLTPRNILYNFYSGENIKELKLSAEERKNIYLIYKEAIHNIIKYAECSQVEISIFLKDKQLGMTIRDNGKGFDINAIRLNGETFGGNGIKNMKARAASANAYFNLNSRVNGGTIIELTLNI